MGPIKVIRYAFFVIMILACSSCYKSNPSRLKSSFTDSLTEHEFDSLSFREQHHYTRNFNFIVKADSMVLLRQQPEEKMSDLITDSFVVHRHDHLVVADIRIIPADSIDSVWVQVAKDQYTFGWQHGKTLLKHVVPDDPISQFISTFSDIHLLIFLSVIGFITMCYLFRKLMRRNARIVHFRDVDSFYPTLLALLVSASATLYASIQMFAPDLWQEFYFHPTLNPFSVRPLLCVFLLSVWFMLIIGLAVIDDIRHLLPFGEAILYLCGLLAVCALDYIVFSLSTLYYVGYLLLLMYTYFAIVQYFSRNHTRFVCGNCGTKLHRKGRCPHCGALNE